MPVILSTSNIIIDYGASNFTMETVKRNIYNKDIVNTTSNLLAEPYLETVSRMYPPLTSRLFTTNNLELKNVISIAGYHHTLFLTDDGKVYSVGRNNYGQLGLGNTTDTSTITRITATIGSLNIKAISAHEYISMFLTDDGKVYSCGYNTYGQLGLNDTANRSVPTLITTNIGSLKIVDISSGFGHSLFLTDDGKVYSCGNNAYGQLGLNDTTNRSVPTLITNIIGTIKKIKSGSAASYILTNDGKVYSCGHNDGGQLGLNDTTNRSVPTLITTNIQSLYISDISAFGVHILFLTKDGNVYSCGFNGSGQLGLGDGTNRSVPTKVNVSNVSSIAAGYLQSLIIINGEVYACGQNAAGGLGTSIGMHWSILNPTFTKITTTIGSFAISNIFATGAGEGGYTRDTSFFKRKDNGAIYGCGDSGLGQLGFIQNQNPDPILINFNFNSSIYGMGLYTVSYSSFTTSSEPFRCFNDTSSTNNAGIWAANNYTSGTGIYNNTSNLVSGYNGDWLVIKLPVSIKLKRFDIKQIGTALNRAPKNFRLYGSINGSSWSLLVDKTNTIYTNLFYVHTDMTQYPSAVNQYYNHFGLVVNSLLGSTETTLSFDELFIYGIEQYTSTTINSINKSLSIPSTLSSLYPNTNLNYTLSFPSITYINNISTNSNLILEGAYNINILSNSSTLIEPTIGQINIDKLSIPLSTTNFNINYHLLNPIIDPIGAQWTYNSTNTNVYHLGNVGIGTNNPSYPLHINGNMYVSSTAYTGSGQTTWSTISDRRIKENIVKASYETCFNNIKNIELYRFNFKNNVVNTNDYNQLGFIAQEVQSVYPKAVEVNKIKDINEEIPDLLSLNTTQINYTLYGAVKELIKKVEFLEQKLENMNSNIILDTSNIIVDTSNIIVDTSNIIVDTSNIIVDTSNIIVDSSNI